MTESRVFDRGALVSQAGPSYVDGPAQLPCLFQLHLVLYRPHYTRTFHIDLTFHGLSLPQGTWYGCCHFFFSLALQKVLLAGQDFHPLITTIPSDLAVREAAKPEKRRASNDDIAALPKKKTMTVCGVAWSRRIATDPIPRRTSQCRWTTHRKLWS